MPSKYKRKTVVSVPFDIKRVTKMLRDNAEEIHSEVIRKTPCIVGGGRTSYIEHLKDGTTRHVMYPPKTEPSKEAELRLALTHVLECLKNWMEVAAKEDYRAYDRLAVRYAERILKETK